MPGDLTNKVQSGFFVDYIYARITEQLMLLLWKNGYKVCYNIDNEYHHQYYS